MRLLTTGFLLLTLSPLFASEYFVATNGNDSNPGTINQPFKTIQKAANIMASGDICHLRAGTYRETVTPANSQVTFDAYAGEQVTISGLDRVTNWSVYSGAIYQASANWSIEQVFVDGEMMNSARYPNSGSDPMHPGTMSLTVNSNFVDVTGPNLNQPTGTWNGGIVWGVFNLRWISKCGTIVSSSPGTIHVTNFNLGQDSFGHGAEWTTGPGVGFITGVLSALDVEREWYWGTNTLYLMAPGSVNPNTKLVEAKKRTWAFVLDNLSGVEISGLHIFGTSISLNHANNCKILSCDLRYINHFMQTKMAWSRHTWTDITYTGLGIAVFGDHNLIRDCTIDWSAGDGITLYGNYNTVENCVIHDCDYSGDSGAGISSFGTGHIITHNTIYNTGISGMLFTGPYMAGSFDHNNVFDVGQIGFDNGCIYGGFTDGQGTTVCYNWFHGNRAGNLGMGIYFDQNSSNYIVHHNAVWDCNASPLGFGMMMNMNTVNMLIYNNTFINNANGIYQGNANGWGHTANLRAWNNILDKVVGRDSTFGWTNFSRVDNLENIGTGVVDPSFIPLSGSPAVDKAVLIPGINDVYSGAGPDIGAYERNGDYWSPGSSLFPNQGPNFIFPVFMPATNIYSDSGTKITGTWAGNGVLTEITGGAYEGTKHYRFRYCLSNTWAGVGLDFSHWRTTAPLDLSRYSTLEIAFKGPAPGDQISVTPVTYDGGTNRRQGNTAYIPGTTNYILRDISFFSMTNGKNFPMSSLYELDIAVTGHSTGSNTLYFDYIRLGTNKSISTVTISSSFLSSSIISNATNATPVIFGITASATPALLSTVYLDLSQLGGSTRTPLTNLGANKYRTSYPVPGGLPTGWKSVKGIFIDASGKTNTLALFQLIVRSPGSSLPPPVSVVTNLKVEILGNLVDFSKGPPSNPKVRIALPKDNTHVKVSVFSVSGSLVKSILDENLNSGIHDIEWDLKSTSGLVASSGVYFIRAIVGDQKFTLKVMVVR